MNFHEFNFICDHVDDNLTNLLFEPYEDCDGPFIRFPVTWQMSHIMHAAGIFKSVNEARKNGWDKPIEKGFSKLIVSKKKIKIFILL